MPFTGEIMITVRAGHRRMARRLGALERALHDETGRRRWGILLGHLSEEFGRHAGFEDQSLYPTLQEQLPETRGLVQQLRAELVELAELFQALRSLLEGPPAHAAEEQFRVLARDLVDLLRLHLDKEGRVVSGAAQRTRRRQERKRGGSVGGG